MRTVMQVKGKEGRSCTRTVLYRVLALWCLLGMAAPAAAEEWIYTVRPGDTLWDISKTYLSHTSYFSKLYHHNEIDDPRKLPPGMHLRIPVAWLRQGPAPVEVISVRGPVQAVNVGGGEPRAVAGGDTLGMGDSLSTGDGGSVSLRFANGSIMVLQAGSRLELDVLTHFGPSGMVDTRLRLQKGRAVIRSRRLQGPASRFEIETPAAVTAVRGTEFRVGAESDRPVARTEVLTGLVSVAGTGATIEVPKDFGTVAEAGKPPLPPRPLLPAPDISGLAGDLSRLPARLDWQPVSGATGYRVLLSDDPELATLIVDETVNDTGFELPLLADDDYVVRIRAIDELSLEGHNADHHLSIDLPPAPHPVVQAPADGAGVAQAQLEWLPLEDVSGYRLQLATDEAFEQLLAMADVEADASGWSPEEALDPGSYYWRMAGRDVRGELGEFGPAASFRIEPPVVGLVLNAPRLSPVGLLLSWQDPAPAGQEDTYYQLQLAVDDGFRSLLADIVFSERQVVMPAPPPGAYYCRVRRVRHDEQPGPYTGPHRFTVVYQGTVAELPLEGPAGAD